VAYWHDQNGLTSFVNNFNLNLQTASRSAHGSRTKDLTG